MTTETLKNYIGGAWLPSSGADTLPVHNPATGAELGLVPLSGAADVERAVTVAVDAFSTWRRVPPMARARYLFKYKNILERNSEELARVITQEHGKTLDESRGEVRRAIENVEHACGIPTLMMGESLEDVAAGIDCETVRQPLGVFAAITPFNFPAMVPLWFWPVAVATGNTFIVKPSEQTPISQSLLLEWAHEAGFPSGVLNLVHGDATVANALIDHPDVAGVSFVGSTAVASKTYERAAAAGKRVQAFGGAKNHMVVMPDAHLDKTANTLVESCFGCAGQRCLAGSVIVAVGGIYDQLVEKLVAKTKEIMLGNGAEPGVTMGPVISPRALDRIASLIHVGIEEGANLLLDGRGTKVAQYPEGSFVGPTVFSEVTGDMSLSTEELFGPVMVIRRAETLADAIAQIQANPYANATSIFTQSGKSAREFRYKAGVSMIGVNIGVPAPMAYFSFGGSKASFFGDTKAHGKDAIRFFTDQKVVISRWF